MGVLLAVFRNRPDAEDAAREVMERTGVSADEVRIGAREDLELSIRAEMDAETAESFGGPGLGSFMTKEMVRGATIMAIVLGGIGLVVGAVLGLVFSGPTSWSGWESTLLGAVVGALFLGTVGTLLGGGLAMRSPEDRLAAERGVTVRFDDVSPVAKDVLAAHHPIRLDRLAGDRRVETVVTEGDSGLVETVRELHDNSVDPNRQG